MGGPGLQKLILDLASIPNILKVEEVKYSLIW